MISYVCHVNLIDARKESFQFTKVSDKFNKLEKGLKIKMKKIQFWWLTFVVEKNDEINWILNNTYFFIKKMHNKCKYLHYKWRFCFVIMKLHINITYYQGWGNT